MAPKELWNPLSDEMLNDPYPRYKYLTDKWPIFYHHGMSSWVLSRYDDCKNVLKDTRTFGRDPRRSGRDLPIVRQNLQTLDPPDQLELRSLLVQSFRAQDFDDIGGVCSEYLKLLLSGIPSKQTFNWIDTVAAPFALQITSLLHGVTPPEISRYAPLSEDVAHMMDSGLCPQNLAPGIRAREQLNRMSEDWFNAESASDFLNHVKSDARRKNVPEHYLNNSIGLMFNASYGTVFAAVGNATEMILVHDDLLARLGVETAVNSAADELIRYNGPAQGTTRTAFHDTSIRGQKIDAGETVVPMLAAANRDPRQFENPDKIILDRKPNNHLAFGWGPHACVGAIFGRLSISILIKALLVTGRTLRLDATIQRRKTATVRSIGTMLVHFEDD